MRHRFASRCSATPYRSLPQGFWQANPFRFRRRRRRAVPPPTDAPRTGTGPTNDGASSWPTPESLSSYVPSWARTVRVAQVTTYSTVLTLDLQYPTRLHARCVACCGAAAVVRTVKNIVLMKPVTRRCIAERAGFAKHARHLECDCGAAGGWRRAMLSRALGAPLRCRPAAPSLVELHMQDSHAL
jgi:hypothetical protein